ncbi:MAG: phage major capsid protein [Bacteroidetes bacterium]|nr:phage major capsid protein [Bacteroidota bacterium]
MNKNFKDLVGKPQRSHGQRAELNESKIDRENRTITMPVSSEREIDFGWYREILVHDQESVNLERLKDGANVLLNHQANNLIGVVEDAFIGDDKRLYATVRFSKGSLGEEVFNDVIDGIRRNVSIGYDFGYDDYEEVSEHPDAKKSDSPLFRIFRWTPLEVSIVSVPADHTVGVGRSINTGDISTGEEPDTKEQDFTNNNELNKPEITMPDIDIAAEERQKTTEEIRALGTSHNLPYDFAIQGNYTIEQYRGYVLQHIPSSKPLSTEAHLDEENLREYSLSRGIRSILNGDDCFEKEVHNELSKKFDKRSKGLLVPQNLFTSKRGKRAAVATGNKFVGTDFRGDLFIDALAPENILDLIGVNMMNGLVGNIEIPKLNSDLGFGWAASEIAAVAEGTLDDGQVQMSPKKGGVFTELSRRLLNQSDLNIELIVRNSIFRSLENTLAKVLHEGSATISGIKDLVNATKVTAADTNRNKLIQFKAAVKQLNASGLRMYWVGNSNVMATLQSRPVVEGQAIFLCSDDNKIISRDALEFSPISDGHLFYGNYENVYIGTWGPYEILTNPYIKDTEGLVRLTMNADTDIAFAHEESFAWADDIS